MFFPVKDKIYDFFLLPTYILDGRNFIINLKSIIYKHILPINCFVTKFVVQVLMSIIEQTLKSYPISCYPNSKLLNSLNISSSKHTHFTLLLVWIKQNKYYFVLKGFLFNNERKYRISTECFFVGNISAIVVYSLRQYSGKCV